MVSLLLACAGLASGCHSAGSICQGTVDRENALFERCATTLGRQWHVVLVLDGMPRECGNVSRVSDPDRLILTCWPWLENTACEDLVIGDPALPPEIDPSCDYGQFEGL